jgi:hypothetical protein
MRFQIICHNIFCGNKKKIIFLFTLLLLVSLLSFYFVNKRGNNFTNVIKKGDTIKGDFLLSIDGYTSKYSNKYYFADSQGINGFKWQDLQPEPGVFNFDKKYLDYLKQGGKKIQLNIQPYSDWALETSINQQVIDGTSGEKTPGFVSIKDEYHEEWKKFIAAAATIDVISYIQIGSESENIWISSEGFTESLCLAYDAIKQTNDSIVVMTTGMNFAEFFNLENDSELFKNKKAFAETVLDNPECFDVFTLHLNRNHDTIEPTISWVKNEMQKRGYQKPIWADDMYSGRWLISPLATKEDKEILNQINSGMLDNWYKIQAEEMMKKIVIAYYSGVSNVFVSSDIDWPTYYMPLWKYGGLLTVEGKEKPAYRLLKRFTEIVGDAKSITKQSEKSYIVSGSKGDAMINWENDFFLDKI